MILTVLCSYGRVCLRRDEEMTIGVSTSILGRAVCRRPNRIRSKAALLSHEARIVWRLVAIRGNRLRLKLGDKRVES